MIVRIFDYSSNTVVVKDDGPIEKKTSLLEKRRQQWAEEINNEIIEKNRFITTYKTEMSKAASSPAGLVRERKTTKWGEKTLSLTADYRKIGLRK